MEECYVKFTDLGFLIQETLNECMGLPPGFLKNYNDDRGLDLMTVRRYFPVPAAEGSISFSEHQDGSCITFICQDDVGGLEVLKDGLWVPAEHVDGSIIVNIGDVIQVKRKHRTRNYYIIQIYATKVRDRTEPLNGRCCKNAFSSKCRC